MATTTHIQVRDARDRLIDLLGFGQTYPLQDLAVRDEQLTVAFNTTAQIPIENSQKDVLYQLHDDGTLVERTEDDEKGSGIPIEAEGNGTRISLETYKIQEDITFKLYAKKRPWYLFGVDLEFSAKLDDGEFPKELRKVFFDERELSFSDQVTVEVEETGSVWTVRDQGNQQAYIIRRQEKSLDVYRSSEKKAYLHQTATVKVGLDTALKASIQDVLYLDASVEPLSDTDPRIIHYGESVIVTVLNSQEGVDYRLVSRMKAEPGQDSSQLEEVELSGQLLFRTAPTFSDQLDQQEFPSDLRSVFGENDISLSKNVAVSVEVPNRVWLIRDVGNKQAYAIRRKEDGLDIYSVTDVRGNLGNIILHTQPIYEDTDVRVHATKTFDPSENRATQTALLDAILPLKVRANPALPVSMAPTSIIDFGQSATIKIADTQRSAKYKIFVRTIPDRNFVHTAVPDTDVIKISVEGEPDVQVRKPARGDVWIPPEEYTEWGDFQQGTGGELAFNLESLTDDCLVIVQAQKEHQATRVVASAIQLEKAAVVLVRPDPAPSLRVKVLMEAAETSCDMQVFDGQPGVFYHFRREPEGDDLALPAYFHKRDDRDEQVNKGLGQLTVGVDYVISRPLPPAIASVNLAEVPPEPPLLETGPLPTDTILYVQVVKAQTRVGTPLAQTAHIAPLPEIRLQDAVVDYGASTKILVVASLEGDKYQPWLGRNTMKRALNGNGEDLSFNTDPITADTEFEVRITRPGDRDIAVERLVRLQATVRPNAKLSVSVVDTIIDYNAVTEIRIEASQSGVSYQLMVDGNPVGEPVEGNDDTIALPSGPLTEDTTFVIRATRIANPDIFVEMTGQVTVNVKLDSEAV